MASNPNELVNFQIKRVKDLSFSVNEKLHNPTKGTQDYRVTVDRELSYNLDGNAILLTLSCYLYYTEAEQDRLATISVQNIYEVRNLSQFISDNELYLPTSLIITLVSISLSHTRALFAKNLAGTIYQERLIPIINPVDITRHFFKYMFDREEGIHPEEHAVNEVKGKAKIVRKKS